MVLHLLGFQHGVHVMTIWISHIEIRADWCDMQTMLNKIRQYGRKLPRKGTKVPVPKASSKVCCFFCTTAMRLRDLVVLHCLLQLSVGLESLQPSSGLGIQILISMLTALPFEL